ncbi:MAG: hypothetical protein AAF206_07575 [Bacteroidota bacterium]
MWHRRARKYNRQLLGENYDVFTALPYQMQRKIHWYMVSGMWMSALFEMQFGMKAQTAQQKLYALAGALLSLSDILIDDVGEKEIDFKKLLRPEVKETDSPGEQLYALYHRCLFSQLSGWQYEMADHALQQLLWAQIASRRQFDQNATPEEIDHISAEKGGWSIVLCRALVGQALRPEEEEAAFRLGSWIQYLNDSQDLHKDLQASIRNFANVRQNLHSVVQDLDACRQSVFQQYRQLDLLQKDRFAFILQAFHIGVLAKLNHLSGLIGPDNRLDQLRRISPKDARSTPFSFGNVRYALGKILQYDRERLTHPMSFQLQTKKGT